MAEKTRELNLFLALIVLPAILLVVGWFWLVSAGLEKMRSDEQADLDLQAELVVEALVVHADIEGYEDLGGPGGPGRPGDGPGRERHGPSLAQICGTFRESGALSAQPLEFEIVDFEGDVLYATENFPERPRYVGKSRLRPPFDPDGIFVAKADGGAGFRTRETLFLTLAVGAAVLLVMAFTAGGVLLVHTIRHERRDARRKADFFDNVSHELKTPLSGIRLNAELLAQGRIPAADTRRGALAAIIREADRLGRMVDELLEFGRLEKGTRKYNLEKVDLAELAADPVAVQTLAALSKGRVRISCKGGLAFAVADVDAVRQIVVCLVSNALKYSDGPVEVSVEGASVSCFDRGPGVPRGAEERVFERFYRADDSLARRVDGSGLGLSIARALARGMGGDVSYSHREGGGSVFTLTLKEA